MVYNWEPHEQTCYRLYIDERKSLEEIMEIMRNEHKFTPRCVYLAVPLWGRRPKWALSSAVPARYPPPPDTRPALLPHESRDASPSPAM